MKTGNCVLVARQRALYGRPCSDQTIDPTEDEGDDTEWENTKKEADRRKGCQAILLLTRRELVSVI